MTRRTVSEWIASHPDAAIPPRVKLRVFNAYNGVCALTNRKIRAGDEWDCDHILALANGGTHRESNLQPVLREAHRRKTADDVSQKAKDERVAKKHRGLHAPKATIPGSKASRFKKRVDGSTVRRDEE